MHEDEDGRTHDALEVFGVSARSGGLNGGEPLGIGHERKRRAAEVWAAGWVPARWVWEVERARAGLAEAVLDERTRGSAVLWRVWLTLEVRDGDMKRAKEVLIQAIAACPLVKGSLYLSNFVYNAVS